MAIAFEGRLLAPVTHRTIPLSPVLPGNHNERVQLFGIFSPTSASCIQVFSGLRCTFLTLIGTPLPFLVFKSPVITPSAPPDLFFFKILKAETLRRPTARVKAEILRRPMAGVKAETLRKPTAGAKAETH